MNMNGEDAAKSLVLVEFVDFGDTATLKLQDVATLRPDFLSMKFQAIECRLSAIMPSKYQATLFHVLSPSQKLLFLLHYFIFFLISVW